MSASTAVSRGLADEAWISWVLDTARGQLNTDIAWVSRFSDNSQVIVAATGNLPAMNVHVGQAADLEGSFCTRVLSGQLPPVVTAAGRDPRTRDLAVTADLNIGSYAGAPLHGPDGRPIGMLCCLSRDDGVGLDRSSVDFLEFLSSLITERLGAGLPAVGSALEDRRARIAAVLAGRQVEAVFQPIVDMRSGEVLSYEALARFVGADTATIFSDAAATGLGIELEVLAAHTAFAAAPDRLHDVRVAVNLSAEALLLPTMLEQLLDRRDQRISVEITEHTSVADYRALSVVRESLRAAGIPFIVDDAGSGYASLRHILELRPDVIKLDVALISGVDADDAKQALVASMLTFGDRIGASLVAEGVEREAERLTLLSLGVVRGQGWLFGRPQAFPAVPPAGLTQNLGVPDALSR